MLRGLMPAAAASLATLADSLVGTFPACDDAPLARALLHDLAKGQPVAPPAAETELTTALARWPNVERDELGRVVAFSGLSLTPTAHRFRVRERQLYTWCAWDTLFLPALLDQPAQVESSCPVTGRAVRLTVDPSGFSDAHPDEPWVSFQHRPRPQPPTSPGRSAATCTSSPAARPSTSG